MPRPATRTSTRKVTKMVDNEHSDEKAQRVEGRPDMRLPGEAFCADCPDHEACWTAYPCDVVRRVATHFSPAKETDG